MANPFSKLTDAFSGLWQKEGASVVGIDVGTSAIKLVQLRKKKGRAILETYGEVALGPYGNLAVGQATNLPPETVGGALKDLFRESNVTAKESAFGIPLQSSLVSLVEMPIPDEASLATMIPLEARKYIPVPVSEVALDWRVIPKRDQDIDAISPGGDPAAPLAKAKTAEVLLVAIHNAMLERFRAIAQEANVQTNVYEIESFSTVRAVAGDDLSPILVIDIGAGSTKLAIVDYGIVRLSHTVGKGSQDITLALSRSLGLDFAAAEEKKRTVGVGGDVAVVASPVLDYIFFEAGQVVGTYQKKYRRSITKVILVGGGSLMKGVDVLAKERFKVDVQYALPFAKVEAPAAFGAMLAEAGPEFSVAVGLALRKLGELS